MDNIIALCLAAVFSLLILLTGNIATTLVAAANIESNTEIRTVAATAPPPIAETGNSEIKSLLASADNTSAKHKSFVPLISGYAWFWYAFLGVFGFEAILKNINITFFDKGVLSISDWIGKARDQALTVAAASMAQEEQHYKQALAVKLSVMPVAVLDAHILQGLGPGRLATLSTAAPLTKALALAYENFGYAKVIQ